MSSRTRYLEAFTQHVQRVPEGGTVISEWQDRGIAHGFVGVKEDGCMGPKLAKQVHGTQIVQYEPNQPWGPPEADGVWTNAEHGIIGIQTADCLPILIFHEKFVMALHAGWRGLLDGMLVQASRLIRQDLGRVEDCLVAFGPSISLQAFEVGPELVDAFTNRFTFIEPLEISQCIQPGKGDTYHLDLKKLAVLQSLHLGFRAEHTWLHEACTKFSPNLWHSYRRDGLAAGRNISWIAKS